jgi:MerR family transcriptional regulator, thiopeptide resistance regulator
LDHTFSGGPDGRGQISTGDKGQYSAVAHNVALAGGVFGGLHLTPRQVVRSKPMSEGQTDRALWAVGDLAEACGVTVRTLHHYDRLGLVTPSARTAAGHRRYGDEDVRRLYTVLALRRLGLSLDAIAVWLSPTADTDLLNLVRRHAAVVDHELRRHQWLRDRLSKLIDAMERTGSLSTERIVEVIEAMDMYEDHLTAPQQARLDRDRSELGFTDVDEWRVLAESALSALRAAHESGVDPRDQRVQDIVQRIHVLRRQFVGRDSEVIGALRGVHDDSAWDDLRAVIPQDPRLRAFWNQARDAQRA